MTDREAYKSQFGLVKVSDLPARERRAKPERKPRKAKGRKLGPLLKAALGR